ncbi:isoprenoid synthase domain-containing protein [Scheffersomyces coipomensis]|uniref:isoprenoid synthase domain-containing protein n=1 Tax=Scheffersomyces coipomensis TaxID=1788519 RepID=UPI00315CD8D5
MFKYGRRSLSIRHYSIGSSVPSDRYKVQLYNATENINKLLESHDRSSYILAQYIPEPARNTFLAIRAFNLEINKINDGGNNLESVQSRAASHLTKATGFSTSDLKFQFWNDLIAKVFTQDPYNDQNDLGEPIAFLLRDGLRNHLNLDISYFHQFLQTRKHFLSHKQFKNIDDICSYGEGTYSQLNYLTQAVLLSPSISPSTIKLLEYSPSLQSKISDIAAHIGQATAIGAMILGMQYYASSRNQITLPIDVMTKFDLSQESLLRLMQGHLKPDDPQVNEIKEKLKNIVYETSIRANDHMLSARDILSKSQSEIKEIVKAHNQDSLIQGHSKKWRKGVPDVLLTPFMVSIPTSLYLRKLEKHDFDLFNPSLQQKEWRLPYTSYRNYYQRRI